MSAGDDIERARKLQKAKNAEIVRRARAAAKATVGGGPSATTRERRPFNNLIPPDYTSFDEAYKRAEWTFGADEAWPRLRGLLAYGKLSAWVVDQEGNPQQIASRFWRGDAADFDPREGIALPSAYTGEGGRVAFSVSEMDERLPWARAANQGRDGAPSPAKPVEKQTVITSEAKIRELIMSIYEFAKTHNAAIPNTHEMPIYVDKLLAGSNHRAQTSAVRRIADEMKKEHAGVSQYGALFRFRGKTAEQMGLKEIASLQFPST